ncbi:MAG: hypothetical protein AAGD22_16655 [Verrucomicrobiota bacterium]
MKGVLSPGAIVALIVALGAGVLAGRHFPGGSTGEVDTNEPGRVIGRVARSGEGVRGFVVAREESALMEEVVGAEVRDFPRLWEKWKRGFEERFDEFLAVRALCRRWVAEDLDGALSYVQERNDDLLRRLLCRAMADGNAGEYFAQIQALEDREVRWTLINLFLNELAQIDPNGLIALGTKTSSYAYVRAVESLATIDPERAAVEALELGYWARDEALVEVGIAWAKRDGKAALRWAEGIESPSARSAAISGVLGQLALSDFDAAAGAAARLLAPIARMRSGAASYGEIAKAIAMENRETAVRWVNEVVPSTWQADVAKAMVEGIRDSHLALGILAEIESESARSQTRDALFGNWGSSDPRLAVAWIDEEIADSKSRGVALKVLAEGVARDNFDAAWAYADTLVSREDRVVFQRGALNHLSVADSGRAIEFAKAADFERGEYESFLYRFVQTAVRSLPPQEVFEVLQTLPQEKRPGHVFDNLAGEFAKDDLSVALVWVDGLTVERERADAVSGLMRHWLQEDAAEATTWLRNQRRGLVRDEGIFEVVRYARDDDPEAALVWAAEISDAKRRRSVLDDIVKRWVKRDPELAWQVVGEAAGIGAADRMRLEELFFP